MANNTPTMDTIAELTSVSKTTVHNALHNKKGVSAATRSKILQTAACLGYRPNLLARGLRLQHSHTIGLVLAGLNSEFFARVLAATEKAAIAADYHILPVSSDCLPDREREMVELLLCKAVDGIIVQPMHSEENREYYCQLASIGVNNVVFVDCHVHNVKVDMVSNDHRKGGYLAGRRLVEVGRKNIVFLTGLSLYRFNSSIQARLAGCNQALEQAGVPPATVVGPNVPDVIPQERFAYHAMRDYLEGGGQLDGLFACNDSLAYAAIKAMSEFGLQVPEDVSVVGHEDYSLSPYFYPPLTTIRQPMESIGQEAVRLIRYRVEKGHDSLPAQRVLLPPSLIVRQSCGGA